MSDTIEYSLVRVFHSTEREKIIGTGFFVGGNWCLTCNHVVRDAGWTAENPIHVWVDFPFLHSPRLKGIVKPTDFPGEYDLALLELEDELPREARPIRLVDSSNVFKHPFRTYGFPHKRESGVWAHGILIAHNIEDFLQIEHTEEKGYFLQRGFSGAPVWDYEENACVGMVVQRDPDTEVAFALSVKGILKCLPELRNQTLPSNPYRGLKPFREEDAPYFFGRDDYTKRLLRAVEGRTPLTTVLGASGSGKSSLVFAGLLPRLRIHPEWAILSMTPGEDPFSALARACLPFLEPEISETDRLREINKLSSALSKEEISFSQVVERIQEKHHKDHLLLFIDQFEQLYKPVISRETIQKFHASVFHPLSSTNDPRWQVVLTLRSEFLEEATRDEIFEKLLNQGEKVFLGAMGRDNLIQAAEAPARKQGVDFEDGLVKRIIDDLEEGSGALPLLEFTLSRLWEEQQNYRLTHQAYENVGKVAGALEAYAESVFSRLSDQERDLARQIFLQLVHLEKKGDKDVFTSRRAWRSELRGERWEVVRKLADTRLLITDHDSAKSDEFVELIHESLLTYWQTLKGWIEENSSFIAWLETARRHREEWERTGQDPNALLKGALLSEALKWVESGAGEIEEPVRKYIEESHKAWMREQQTRKRRERMVRQWLAGMALIFLVLAGWAWRERASALAQRNLALANQLAAQAQQLNANTQNSSDQVLAPLLAIESLRLHDSPEARSVLHQTLFERLPISHILRHKGPVNTIAFSPDDKYFATASNDGSALLFETNTWREILRVNHDRAVETIAFSPDGHYFASGSYNKVILVEIDSGNIITDIQHDERIVEIAFSPDGKYFATGSYDQTSVIIETHSGREIARIQHDDIISGIAFSPNGKYFALYNHGGTAMLVETTSGRIISIFDNITDINFSQDNKYFIPISWTGEAILFEITSKRELTSIDYFGSISFSPDGKHFVTGRSENTIVLGKTYPLSISKVVDIPYNDAIQAITFSTDGNHFVAGGAKGTIILGEISSTRDPARIQYGKEISKIIFSQDGHYFAVQSSDYYVGLFETSSGRLISQVQHEDYITNIIFSPDDYYLATASSDGTSALVEVSSGREINRIQHGKGITNIAFSQDGRYFVSGSSDGIVALISMNLFQERTHITDNDEISDIVFSPDGYIFTTSSYALITIIETRSWREITRIEYSMGVDSIAFSPNNRYLFIGSDRIVVIYDAVQWQKLAEIQTSNAILGAPTGEISFSPDGQSMGIRSLFFAALLQTESWQEIDRFAGILPEIVFSSHGKYAGIRSLSNDATLVEVNSGHELAVFNNISHVTFSPDEAYFVTGSTDGTVTLVETSSGHVIKLFQHNDRVDDIAFSPDGKYLVTSSWDGTVIILETSSWNEIDRIQHSSSVLDINFSPDGTFLATGSYDGKVLLFNINTRSEPVHIHQHSDGVYTIAFSPDGKYFATGSWDGSAVLVETASGRELNRIQHNDIVTGIAFSPDSRYFATGSNDGSAVLVETASGRELDRIQHDGNIQEIAFSPDGKYFATAGGHSVYLLPISRETLIEKVCARLTRNLTPEEWEKYIGKALPYHPSCPNLPAP